MVPSSKYHSCNGMLGGRLIFPERTGGDESGHLAGPCSGEETVATKAYFSRRVVTVLRLGVNLRQVFSHS